MVGRISDDGGELPRELVPGSGGAAQHPDVFVHQHSHGGKAPGPIQAGICSVSREDAHVIAHQKVNGEKGGQKW